MENYSIHLPSYSIGSDVYNKIPEICSAYGEKIVAVGGKKAIASVKELLQKAVGSIVQQKEESDLESLFSFGETTALVGDIAGLDDFELICFLVIKEGGQNG